MADRLGGRPKKNPIPSPPNEACVMPPLMNTSRLVTTYVPIIPQAMLAKRLPRRAFRKNAYSSSSGIFICCRLLGVHFLASQLIDDHQYFIFQLIRKSDPSHLETSYPAGFLMVEHRVEYLSELIHLFSGEPV